MLTYVWLSGLFAARPRYLFAAAAHWLRTLTLSAPRHSPGLHTLPHIQSVSVTVPQIHMDRPGAAFLPTLSTVTGLH